MFLIGILSSPLPYAIAIFSYLLAFSYGYFAKTDNTKLNEKYISNISDYEQLVPNNDGMSHENFHYSDFYQNDNNNYQSVDIVKKVSNLTFELRILPPLFYPKYFSFLAHSFFSNRPPPLYS